MLYTQKTLTALEYDKIVQALAERALTEGAKARALSLLPSNDYEEVVRRQKHTADARRLLAQKGYPPFSGVQDILGAVERAEKGASLSPRELLNIATVLQTARALLDYQNSSEASDNSLQEIFGRLLSDRTLERRITGAIVSEDTIADEASPALADIRRKMRAANNRIKEILQKYASGALSRYLQENIVTTRDGRYVVPVKVEYRNEVKGLVHDTSSSGATLFIEPMAVVDANNELRMLENKEQQEIARILAELSALCVDHSGTITTDYLQITELAFIFSCASLAESMHAEAPQLRKEPVIALRRARHPLLDPERVVPIDVALGQSCRTLVITGPNTGGKTVTLKTLGLFALMVQAGLQIPASELSEIGIFQEILVDIGDEQSIEQSLSTFSSHMVNIISLLDRVTPGSLILFDELGAGTDPVEGAALANAILEWTKSKGALTAATTHYAELKAYALECDGVQNASCEFDVETLRPTYRLIVGTPGKSNAFAISSKLGLRDDIIAVAEGLVSGNSRRFENVIEKLEQSRIEMERERNEAARLRTEYAAFKEKAESRMQKQLAEAEKESDKMREKARQTLESARATSDYVLKQLEDIRKKQQGPSFAADLSSGKRDIRAHLSEAAQDVYAKPSAFASDEPYTLPRPLRLGDEVYLVGLGQNATVESLPDKNNIVRVRAGILSAKIPLEQIRLVEKGKKEPHSGKATTKGKERGKTDVSHDFKAELDVRGMIGEDAWILVDKYLDEALLSGMQSVRIIHGKGTGALRTALQNDLHHDPRVRSYRNGAYGEGDLGVTVVELK